MPTLCPLGPHRLFNPRRSLSQRLWISPSRKTCLTMTNKDRMTRLIPGPVSTRLLSPRRLGRVGSRSPRFKNSYGSNRSSRRPGSQLYKNNSNTP